MRFRLATETMRCAILFVAIVLAHSGRLVKRRKDSSDASNAVKTGGSEGVESKAAEHEELADVPMSRRRRCCATSRRTRRRRLAYAHRRRGSQSVEFMAAEQAERDDLNKVGATRRRRFPTRRRRCPWYQTSNMCQNG